MKVAGFLLHNFSKHFLTETVLSNSKTCKHQLRFARPSIDSYRKGRVKMTSELVKVKPQNFDYLLVLDFEATCDQGRQQEPQEIIEFPVLKLNPQTLKVESTFHRYVCPKVHQQLTYFCIELTGILQDMVDNQPHLEQVLQEFDDWLKAEGLLDDGVKFAFVTCGDWDLKMMLKKQCSYFNIPRKDYFNQWINIKKSFCEVMSVFPKGLPGMLTPLGLKLIGRHHSGIDDCKNINNITVELLKKGHVFKITGRNSS